MNYTAVIPDPKAQPFMTVREVGRATGSNVKTVYAAIDRGDIPFTRLGGKVLVPTAWVAAQARLGLDPQPAA